MEVGGSFEWSSLDAAFKAYREKVRSGTEDERSRAWENFKCLVDLGFEMTDQLSDYSREGNILFVDKQLNLDEINAISAYDLNERLVAQYGMRSGVFGSETRLRRKLNFLHRPYIYYTVEYARKRTRAMKALATELSAHDFPKELLVIIGSYAFRSSATEPGLLDNTRTRDGSYDEYDDDENSYSNDLSFSACSQP